jgi:hypothetical protein
LRLLWATHGVSANAGWNFSSLTTVYSDGVVLYAEESESDAIEFVPILMDANQGFGEFAFYVTNVDNSASMLIDGVVFADGTALVNTTNRNWFRISFSRTMGQFLE